MSEQDGIGKIIQIMSTCDNDGETFDMFLDDNGVVWTWETNNENVIIGVKPSQHEGFKDVEYQRQWSKRLVPVELHTDWRICHTAHSTIETEEIKDAENS